MGIHGAHRLEGDLRQFGLSKDTGGVARQFALGVMQTAEGLPIAHELLEGNVAETRTLAPMITRLLERFALVRVLYRVLRMRLKAREHGPGSVERVVEMLESVQLHRGATSTMTLAENSDRSESKPI